MASIIMIETIPLPLINVGTVLAINIVGLLLLTTVVIRNSLRDKLASVFFVMGVLMFMWVDFAYAARVIGQSNIPLAELCLRIAWVATPPFFAYLYLITVHMVRQVGQLSLLNKLFVAGALVLSLATAFTDFIIEGVDFSSGNLDIVYGSGFYPFLGIISLYIGATLIPIFTAKVEEHRKKRVRIFIAGVAIFYTANLIFNITLPVFFGVTHLYYFGDYSLIFLLGLTAYAIIRHRLLDIRTIIFRAVAFASLTTLFFVTYGIGTYGVLSYLAQFNVSIAIQSVMATATMALAVPSYRYFRTVLSKVTDRFFFQNKVNYQKALATIGKELSGTIDINQVSDSVLHAMKEFVRVRKTIIMLWDEERLEYVPTSTQGVEQFQVTVPSGHPLIHWLREHKAVAIKDEIRTSLEGGDLPEQVQGKEEYLIETFEWLDAAVVIPLFVHQELTGLILLGEKLSGEQFSQEDVDFLEAFSPQAATALENARLYQQSLEFNERLRKEVEAATKELAQANIQLKNLDKAKSEFLSIASHQLYTPLTALRGYISMLKEGDFGEINEKQEPVLDILQKSASRLIDLIKNLLDISRIESGRLELNLESISVIDLSRELVADLMPNAINKNLKLEFHEPSARVANVVADRERLRQVMLNFIDNAIKYTPAGRIDVRVYKQENHICFAVKDTGKGIKHEDIAKLFNKFMRVGGASRFHTEGTGLGLYVARQIISEHHGEVHVDSPGEGLGSTFTMLIPAEGSERSLKAGDHASVEIKAAEARMPSSS